MFILTMFLFVLALCIAALVCKVLREKSFQIKIIYLNSLTSISTIFIAALGGFASNRCYIDIAIIYALLGFIANNAYLKYAKTLH